MLLVFYWYIPCQLECKNQFQKSNLFLANFEIFRKSFRLFPVAFLNNLGMYPTDSFKFPVFSPSIFNFDQSINHFCIWKLMKVQYRLVEQESSSLLSCSTAAWPSDFRPVYASKFCLIIREPVNISLSSWCYFKKGITDLSEA